MSAYAIKVEGLGKKYLLRHQASGKRYVALRDVLAGKAKALFSNRKSEIGNRKSVEEFWALQDVSFEVKPGEAVGVIGRNGAGKSTLLKLLSRITGPTAGRIRLRGRVASLLEVGTGFHPELTGRENIFLNGAVLGMHRAEIRKKFDEIVAFAEVEKFLDTPVKHYSSGMYVRLAFAVAAHLEPEILIVDEVLAVGDLEFQKKCLGKMEHVTGQEGRTVLFVSHNMDLITKLCHKALLLTAGRAGTMDAVENVTRSYINLANAVSSQFVTDKADRALQRIAVDQDALLKEKLIIRISFKLFRVVPNPIFGVVVYTEGGTPIFGSNSLYHPPAYKPDNMSEGEAVVIFEYLPLWSGRYTISVWLGDTINPIDDEMNAVMFEFVSPRTPLNAPPVKNIGPVHLQGNWEFNV
jgi:lipopolysaccharide transport system ATP-binding protein